MQSFLLRLTFLISLASANHVSAKQNSHHHQDPVIIHTTSGAIQGHLSAWPAHQTTVLEFLGIPYAQPPLRSLRFLPPQPLPANASHMTIIASNYSQTCMQLRATTTAANNTVTPQFQAYEVGMGNTGPLTYGEDCLTVNVWSPQARSASDKPRAVMVWIYGGGFLTGTSAAPFYNGARLAHDEDVVVISFNYRLSIFGFPNAPSNEHNSNNLGLLDQRAAIEWVRDNAVEFGGDADRIALVGESSGAASVDLYAYAWTADPIVNGFIAQSGSAFALNTPPANETLWFAVAAALGCETGDGSVACMRTKDADEIMEAVGVFTGGSTTTGFVPTADATLVFDDIESRSAAGNFVKKPFLTGHNDKELGLVKVFPPGETLGGLSSNATDEVIQFDTEFYFGCGAGKAASARMAHGVPAWRYRYMAVWNNTALTNSTGAYHSAEIPFVFGTNPLRQNSAPDTVEEAALEKTMMHAWATFAKDPAMGLTGLGWPEYSPNGTTLVRLGYQNQPALNLGPSTQYDSSCP